MSDGSLGHLGSESGKVFLQDHDDIKSQFLGFCLKSMKTYFRCQPRVLRQGEVFVSPAKQKRDICTAFPVASLSSSSAATAAA